MAAYLIFQRDTTKDPESMKTYASLAGPSMAGHAATPHVVYGQHEVLEGPDVEGVVVVSFPTVVLKHEFMMACFNSIPSWGSTTSEV